MSPAEILITAAASAGNVAATLVIVSAFTRKAIDDARANAADIAGHITRECIHVGESLERTRDLVAAEAEGIRAFVAASVPKKRGRKPKASEPST